MRQLENCIKKRNQTGEEANDVRKRCCKSLNIEKLMKTNGALNVQYSRRNILSREDLTRWCKKSNLILIYLHFVTSIRALLILAKKKSKKGNKIFAFANTLTNCNATMLSNIIALGRSNQ